MRSLIRRIIGLTCLTALLIAFSSNAFSEGKKATPPTLQQQNVEHKTVYQYFLLPGIRLCDRDTKQKETLTRINCQTPELINAISTRDREIHALERGTIVPENVAPNGNILRINFSRKASRKK